MVEPNFIKVGNSLLREDNIDRVKFIPSRKIATLEDCTIMCKNNFLKRLFGAPSKDVICYRTPFYGSLSKKVNSINEWRFEIATTDKYYVDDNNTVWSLPQICVYLKNYPLPIEDIKSLNYTKQDFLKEYKTIIKD